MTKQPLRSPEEAHLREFALTYPDAVEEYPWGHRAMKVKGKIFLTLGGTEQLATLSVKLPHLHRIALLQPFASPTGYGLGKSGWVTASFADGEKIPVDVLEQWIDESYRALAPKKLVARLDAPTEDGEPAPEPKKQRQRSKRISISLRRKPRRW